MSGIKTTQGLYKFYYKAATTITKRLIEEGYKFDTSYTTIDGFVLEWESEGKLHNFIEDLTIPDDKETMKFQIRWRVEDNLRRHRKGEKMNYYIENN